MTVRSTLDLDFFQQSLASAFVIQQSLMDVQLPSALLTLRHLISAGEIDVSGVMHLIAGRARNVANATGAAIGLLKGDQLVYRAGSGTAATYIGRHLTATLTVSGKHEPKGEILRVEDAETGTGIGRAICHQFEAKALLLLPIYQEQVLGGLLQVFFNEAHAFQDDEVCAYQSMASVVGEVTVLANVEPKKPPAPKPSTMPPLERATPPMQRFQRNNGAPAHRRAIWLTGGATIPESEKLVPDRALPELASRKPRPKRVPLYSRMQKGAGLATAVVVLLIATWFAYTHRRPVRPLSAVAHPRPNTVEQQEPLVPTELGSTKKHISTPQTASVPMNNASKAARSTPRQVKIGDDEVDYISEDVTVRHFKRKPAVQLPPLGVDQVDYVSEDVTVRRFAPKLAVVSPRQPVDHAAGVASIPVRSQ
jgi:hypothetical protein